MSKIDYLKKLVSFQKDQVNIIGCHGQIFYCILFSENSALLGTINQSYFASTILNSIIDRYLYIINVICFHELE